MIAATAAASVKPATTIQARALTKAELSAIENAGLSVYVVFQHCGAQCLNFDLKNKETAEKGRKDAEGALALARELGQPAHTPIYFAIDFDPVERQRLRAAGGSDLAEHRCVLRSDQPSLRAHALAGRKSMVRARTCQRLKDSGKAKYFWLSTSLGHSGGRSSSTADKWHLFQNLTEIKRSYARNTFDTDVTNPGAAYFGQWTTHGRAPAHDAIAAIDILACRAFVKSGCAVVPAIDGKKAKTAARTSIFNATCRILTVEEDGYLGISMTEDDFVDGYVHKSDVVTGGLLRNMPAFNAAKQCAPCDAAGIQA